MLKKVLITGFEKFDSLQENPTELMLKDYQNSLVELTALVLPVSFQRSFGVLTKHIDLTKPDLIILTGVAAGRKNITLEKIAINLQEARIPDVDGWQPKSHKIVNDAPDGIFTTFPIENLFAYMCHKKVDCTISYSAGTYVCNHIYYSALQHLSGSIPVLFVHFPLAEGCWNIESFQQFLDQIINFVIHKSDKSEVGNIAIGTEY